MEITSRRKRYQEVDIELELEPLDPIPKDADLWELDNDGLPIYRGADWVIQGSTTDSTFNQNQIDFSDFLDYNSSHEDNRNQ
jgi:hypothetical protein